MEKIKLVDITPNVNKYSSNVRKQKCKLDEDIARWDFTDKAWEVSVLIAQEISSNFNKLIKINEKNELFFNDEYISNLLDTKISELDSNYEYDDYGNIIDNYVYKYKQEARKIIDKYFKFQLNEITINGEIKKQSLKQTKENVENLNIKWNESLQILEYFKQVSNLGIMVAREIQDWYYELIKKNENKKVAIKGADICFFVEEVIINVYGEKDIEKYGWDVLNAISFGLNIEIPLD